MSPSAARRVCAEPRCPALAEVGKARCRTHLRAYDRRRGTARERGYDSAWTAFSKKRLQRLPVCGMRADGQLYADHSLCVQEGRTVAAQCTDHILSMRNGGAKYDEANLQSLCHSCNARKRAMVDCR